MNRLRTEKEFQGNSKASAKALGIVAKKGGVF